MVSKTTNNYQEQLSLQIQLKITQNLKLLPKFCTEFFIGIENSKRPQTRLRYSYDLKPFFVYIHKYNPKWKNANIVDYPIELLEDISVFEIEQYLSHVKSYIDENGKERTNGRAGVKSKLAAIKALYNYYYKHGIISKNTPLIIELPRIEEKNIIRLDDEHVAEIIENIENGTYLTSNEFSWNQRFKERDYAVILLLLGTGIRVSECVGIDISDINFDQCYISIIRKGGNEDKVYFSDEVHDALRKYYNIRVITATKQTNEQAFFLSSRGTRLSIRSIQNLVHKYTKGIYEVSPHKLRTTFGTNLYVATKDIYLVSTALGHRNVETTRKHYADIPDIEKQKVRNMLKIKKD